MRRPAVLVPLAVVAWNAICLFVWHYVFIPASTVQDLCFPDDAGNACPPLHDPVLWHGVLIWNALLAVPLAVALLVRRAKRRRTAAQSPV